MREYREMRGHREVIKKIVENYFFYNLSLCSLW